MIKPGTALVFKLSAVLVRYSELSPSHDEILSLGGQGGGKGAAGARKVRGGTAVPPSTAKV